MNGSVAPPLRPGLFARFAVPLLAFAAGALGAGWFASRHPAGAAERPAVASVAASVAGNDPAVPVTPSSPVAVVNGDPVTLRALEDELLRKEGAEQVEDALHRQLENTAWSKLADSDTIVATSSWRLSRLMLAAQLLRSKAAPVREDLINLKLVEQALAKEHVAVDSTAIDGEVARMEKRLREGLEKRKQPYVDFRTFIQQTEKMPLEEFTRQPGFRMLTGMHLLVQRRAKQEMTDAELEKFFNQHIDRYRMAEAVDISDIFIPFQTEKGADGKESVSENERNRLLAVMRQFHAAITKQQVSFARTFNTFGKPYDQNATPEGRLGWVMRDGSRGVTGARAVSRRAVDEAFATQPPFPALLEPQLGETGVDLILVHDRRPTKEAVFARERERVLVDQVDAEIESRTKRLMEDLRRAAVIDYLSLPELIQKRAEQAKLPGAVAPAPSGAGAVER